MMVNFFLAIKYFFLLKYVHFLRHNAIAHLIDCNNVNIAFIGTGKQKNSCDSLYCDNRFVSIIPLLWESGTKPTIFLRYTCV